jgi:diacylglycerol kinase family enzyme
MGATGENLAQEKRARRGAGGPLTGVIYNPLSHRNKGLDSLVAAHDGVLVARPESRAELAEALARFAAAPIDFLVINGGDGTVRDVLTVGMPLFAGRWPELAVLPKGKTNALNVDLGAPADWSLAGALEAFADGERVVRRPLTVERIDLGADAEDAYLAGFIFGAGAFTIGISAGQDAHRLGAFNSLAVAVTAAWGVLQALFGGDRNIWRRGVEMRVLTGSERAEVPHSSHGDPAKREFLLASTLHRFPFGMKPFGSLRDGLKLAVMDKPLRRLLLMLPRFLAGWEGEWLRRHGMHRVLTDRVELELKDRFILDGEAFAPGRLLLREGPELTFVVP